MTTATTNGLRGGRMLQRERKTGLGYYMFGVGGPSFSNHGSQEQMCRLCGGVR